MSDVVLKKIDESNYLECFRLELGPGQERFVSNPVRSLAQAYVYYHQCTPFGVFDGARMVGYVMVICDYDEQVYNIWHMMIDRREQGKGYGRAAMERALEYIRQKPFGDFSRVALTCSPENEPALKLYRSMGFAETGRRDEDEIELALTL